eukprot:6914149-Ditylum_brightwellii.AAC.1
MQKIESNGINKQIIANVLQQEDNFCGAAQVLNCWKKSKGGGHVSMSTVRHHIDKCMQARKVKMQKVASGSKNTYSPWARASFHVAKQLAIWCVKLNPFTTLDPLMPLPPPGTDNKWVKAHHHDKAKDKKSMNLLIEKENTC